MLGVLYVAFYSSIFIFGVLACTGLVKLLCKVSPKVDNFISNYGVEDGEYDEI